MLEFLIDLNERAPEIATAAPVIAGALTSLLGLLAGWAVSFWQTKHNRDRQSRLEKFKELRSNLYTIMFESSKILAWAYHVGAFYVSCATKESGSVELKIDEPFPAEKIRAIASVYFPEIRDVAYELWGATHQHHKNAFEYLKIHYNGKEKSLTNDQISAQQREQRAATGKSMEEIIRVQKKFEREMEKLMKNLLDEKSPQRW